jgi:hypothetical protein
MPGPSVIFNRLSSLYFEVESSGGDDLSFANPLAMDQLSLVQSSGGLALPHEEGACLSPALPTENEQEQDLFQG